jgi:hypothetical protein
MYSSAVTARVYIDVQEFPSHVWVKIALEIQGAEPIWGEADSENLTGVHMESGLVIYSHRDPPSAHNGTPTNIEETNPCAPLPSFRIVMTVGAPIRIASDLIITYL